MLSREYLKKNMDFKKYCADNGLSVDKILNLPSFYNAEMIGFQVLDDHSRFLLGLKDDRPARTVLLVKKDGDKLVFEASEDIKDVVGE